MRDDRGEIKCMYTNIDTYNNKRSDILSRIAVTKPDIIGLTEINPKNAKWSLEQADLQIEGYTVYYSLEGRGVALYIGKW